MKASGKMGLISSRLSLTLMMLSERLGQEGKGEGGKQEGERGREEVGKGGL